VNYFAGLFAIRAAHPAFRMSTTDQIKANLKFTTQNANVISYVINGAAVGDSAKSIFVVHNAGKASANVKLPSSGSWSILVKGSKASITPLGKVSGTKVSVDAYSTLVLTK
jgi:pullulanase